MTQFQNNESLPDMEQGEDQERKKAKEQQLKKLKFYGVVAAMVILCAVFIWFIFKPNKETEEGVGGLNVTVPEASVAATESDKLKAIEIEQNEERQRNRVRSLSDFANDIFPDSEQPVEPPKEQDHIAKSRDAARQLNSQMATFYHQPKEDTKVAELQAQIEELNERLSQQHSNPYMDEMAFMEKSYELAAKYFPGTEDQLKKENTPAITVEDKTKNEAAWKLAEEVVSSLAETVVIDDQPRNYGFVTPVGGETVKSGNAIRACISDEQIVTAGARVKLRLLDPLKVGNSYVGVNASLYGTARIEGQRLSIVVSSIESEGSVIPVELVVHDMDGQAGLYVPNSTERTAAKEALASIGQGFGTSISFAQSAGQQVAMDLTRGVMTGGSQYLGTKMREVKIKLKANYQVLLISKN